MLLLLQITGFQNHWERSWPIGWKTGWQGVIGTGLKKKKKTVLLTRALVFYQRNNCAKDKLKKTWDKFFMWTAEILLPGPLLNLLTRNTYISTPSLYTSLSAPGEWFLGDGQARGAAPAELTCRKLSWQQRNSFFFMMDSALRSSSFLLRAGSLRHGKTASSIERKQCDLDGGRGQYSVKEFIRDKTTSPRVSFQQPVMFLS